MRFIPYLVVLSVCTTSCRPSNGNEPLLVQLRQTLERPLAGSLGYRTFRLDSLTDFAWDSVYFFHGEESADFIRAITHTTWSGPDVPNLHKRLLFTLAGRVVSYVDCNDDKPNEEFEQVPPLPIFVYLCDSTSLKHRVLARKEAVFATFKDTSGQTFHYPLIPLRCVPKFARASAFKQLLK